MLAGGAAHAQPTGAKKPNILVIWGDDIGTWNISHNNRGMMGYQTPNIDRIAKEGVAFTDYYAQQSCTAGRAAFISGSVPVRTGMTKVGLPGAKEGWQKTDVTMATVLKSQGYATGQFGKNHQGDRDEHLPTMHGFDEFLGNLYHLNAEEEPENEDYPADMGWPTARPSTRSSARAACCTAGPTARAGRTIEDTGPLTKKRMETIDDETVAAAKDFITRQHKAGKPFFVWWNGTRMHFRTHVRKEQPPPGQRRVHRRHDRARHARRRAAEAARRAGHRRQHRRDVLHRQRPALQHLARRRHDAVPQREELATGKAPTACPAFVRWPGHFPAGVTLNGIVSHEDWLPTFAAVAGAPDIKDKLPRACRAQRSQLPQPHRRLQPARLPVSGKVEESPRNEFMYVNDDGQIVAIRYDAWKAVFLENRGEAFDVWREPFTELRVPLLFNLRRDPFEKAQHNSNTYNDWFLDRVFVLVPIQAMAAKFLHDHEGLPAEPVAGLVQPGARSKRN